jgi:hypothetical protein
MSKEKLGTLRYIETPVIKVWEQIDKVHVSGIGNAALFEDRSRGWFVQFKGSYEAIFFGTEKPDIAEGDWMKISFEKIKGT